MNATDIYSITAMMVTLAVTLWLANKWTAPRYGKHTYRVSGKWETVSAFLLSHTHLLIESTHEGPWAEAVISTESPIPCVKAADIQVEEL